MFLGRLDGRQRRGTILFYLSEDHADTLPKESRIDAVDGPRIRPLGFRWTFNFGFQRESVARRPYEAARHAKLGDILMSLAKVCRCRGGATSRRKYSIAINFSPIRQTREVLHRAQPASRRIRGLRTLGDGVMPNSDGNALPCVGWRYVRLGERRNRARRSWNALAFSPDAFEAAERLLSPLASDPDGGDRLLALCEEFPSSYSNSTIVRGYRAIALSRVGRVDEARILVDLERYPARTTFEPPAEFGGIERFNALLADEILRNPGLRHTSSYGFRRTEQLAILGAQAFPVLAKFLRSAIEDYIAEFARRGLDVILPPPPREGFLDSGWQRRPCRGRPSSSLA